MLSVIDKTGYSKKKVWCGPAALATLTGVKLKDATELLVSVMAPEDRNYMALEGVHDVHMALALGALGYHLLDDHDFYDRYSMLIEGPSLKRFVAEKTLKERSTMMLIAVPEHYIATHLSYLNDGWTITPKHIDHFPKNKRRVKQVWFVEKKIS